MSGPWKKFERPDPIAKDQMINDRRLKFAGHTRARKNHGLFRISDICDTCPKLNGSREFRHQSVDGDIRRITGRDKKSAVCIRVFIISKPHVPAAFNTDDKQHAQQVSPRVLRQTDRRSHMRLRRRE